MYESFEPGDLVKVIADSTTNSAMLELSYDILPLDTFHIVDRLGEHGRSVFVSGDPRGFSPHRFTKASQLEKLLYLYGRKK